MGMRVEEFGFGFPPRAWGKKKNGTLYSINWLPLGGFVKIKGEDGSHFGEADSFSTKKPWQKLIVLAAGVIMNLVLASVLLSVGYIFGLPQAVDGLQGGDVRDLRIQIVQVLPDSPADQAELLPGDIIRKYNNEPVVSSQQLMDLNEKNVSQSVSIEFQRGKENFIKNIPIIVLKETGKGGIGVGLMATGIVSYPIHLAVIKGVQSTYYITIGVAQGLSKMVKDLFTGNGVAGEVSGPVGIAVLTGQVATLGVSYLIQFTALLSVNLAVLNFIRFPALDGGRAVFVLIEKLRGKPINQRAEGLVHAAGFALLMILVIIVTFKDVARLIQ